jgi:hypothetical protein
MATYMSSIGGFHHVAYLEETGQLLPVLRILWVSQPFAIIGIMPGKIAIGITLLRILGQTASKTLKWILYVMFALTTAIATTTVLLMFFQCKPVYALWTPDAPATCLNPSIQTDFAVFSGGRNPTDSVYLSLSL